MKNKLVPDNTLRYLIILSIASFIVFMVATFVINQWCFFTGMLSLCIGAMAYRWLKEHKEYRGDV